MYELAFIYYIVYAILMTGISFYSIRLYSTRNYLVNNSRTPRVVLFIVLLLLIVFCATGDYWSYRMWYETGVENTHFEPIWESTRSLIPWGFDIYRLVLWGGGLILFSLMCKWHRSDYLISYTIFALFYISTYAYARATIAYILIFFAYYIFISQRGKNFILLSFNLVIIILCIVIGVQMHRSMPILLVLMALSLFIRPKRNTFIILLILFPLISYAFNTFLYPYIISYISTDEDVARLAIVYLEEDTRGLVFFIRQLTYHAPILILFILSLMNILKNTQTPKVVRDVAFLAFIIVYSSFLFYTIKEGNGLALFYRTMNMAYPFMIMSIAYSMKYINTMSHITLVVIVYKVAFTFLVIFQVLSNPQYLYDQVFERYF